jgi:hypothetical protein
LHFASTKRRRYLKRHARRSLERKIAWRNWRRIKRGGHSHKVTMFREGRRETGWAVEQLIMPKVLCLDSNLDETLAYIGKMRTDIFEEMTRWVGRIPKRRMSRHIRRYFDFGTIEHITPTAALVIAALFDRRKAITRSKNVTVNEHEWSPEVLSVLRMLGFHELLEMSPQYSAPITASNLRILKFVSGEKVEGRELGQLQDQLLAFLPEDEREFLLYAEPYAGMLEAALNSHMWAYRADHVWDHPMVPRWWMTGAIDTANKTVTVAVYDQGISIPGSLPHWEHWNKLQRWVLRLGAFSGVTAPLGDPVYDSAAIRLAMAISRTSSGLPQHGKGLHTMLEVVERAKSGRLRILSRNGEYIKATGHKAFSRNLRHGLEGTLVEWQIQL